MSLKQFYYKKNRLQQLKGFCYVAEIGNVSKAAEKIGLNQSTVTLQIQSLERDLKTKLFEKKANRLNLTKDGKILYEMSSGHLHAMDSIYESFLERKKQLTISRIDIAVHHIAIAHILPGYVKQFTKLHPNIIIGIHNISPEEALERLNEDKLDFIIYPNINLGKKFIAKIFCSFDAVLIMRKDHPLAKKKQIEIRDIIKYNTVRIDKKLITLPLFEQVFKEFNFQTNIEFENSNWEIIKYYVKAGIGVGFVSTICINDEDDLVYKKLDKYFPAMDYKIIVKKSRKINNLVCDFINIIDPGFFSESQKILGVNSDLGWVL